MSRYRPRAPIIAVTRNAQAARQAHLYRGIFPVMCKDTALDAWAEDVDLRVNLGMNVGKKSFMGLSFPSYEMSVEAEGSYCCENSLSRNW